MQSICKKCLNMFETSDIDKNMCEECEKIYNNFMRFETQKINNNIENKNLLLEG